MANYDSNGAVLRYLLTIAGPAYSCHRYWDWIEPYLETNMNNANHDEGDKLKFACMMTCLEKVKKDRAEFFEPLTD